MNNFDKKNNNLNDDIESTNILDKVKSTFNKATDKTKESFNKLSNNIKNKFNKDKLDVNDSTNYNEDNNTNTDVESTNVFDKIKTTFNKVTDKTKESFNTLSNNIKNKFNKDDLDVNESTNLNNDNDLENVSNIAFYRKKSFIFGSIGILCVALLATAIAVPLAQQQNSFANNVVTPPSEQPPLKPTDPLDFVTKLKIVNNLSNNEKINIWNSYVNSPGVALSWRADPSKPTDNTPTADQTKILNYLKNKFNSFANPSQEFILDKNSATKVNLSNLFNTIIDSLIANNEKYYFNRYAFLVDPSSTVSKKISFLNLSSQISSGLSTQNIQPIVRLVSNWNGIPTSSNDSGVDINNVIMNFTLSEMSIKFPYNYSYFQSNKHDASNKAPFVFYLEDLSQPFVGFSLKPINDTIIVSNSDSIFSNFTTWMEDHLTKNYN